MDGEIYQGELNFISSTKDLPDQLDIYCDGDKVGVARNIRQLGGKHNIYMADVTIQARCVGGVLTVCLQVWYVSKHIMVDGLHISVSQWRKL